MIPGLAVSTWIRIQLNSSRSAFAAPATYASPCCASRTNTRARWLPAPAAKSRVAVAKFALTKLPAASCGTASGYAEMYGSL